MTADPVVESFHDHVSKKLKSCLENYLFDPTDGVKKYSVARQEVEKIVEEFLQNIEYKGEKPKIEVSTAKHDIGQLDLSISVPFPLAARIEEELLRQFLEDEIPKRSDA